MPIELSDEIIFKWEHLEVSDQINQLNEEETMKYNEYKKLKQRYIFEVTNWFQTPLENEGK